MTPVRSDGHRELFSVERLDQLLLNCGCISAEDCVARIRTERGLEV